jgi:hypothetical protein
MATEIMMRHVGGNGAVGALIADTTLDGEALEKIPSGKVVKVVVTVPRNPKFHRKFFALLSVIYDCMEEDTKRELNVWTAEELRNRLKIDTGRYTLHIVGENSTLPVGTCVYIPDSMAYEAMDDVEFEALYEQTMMMAISKYITGQNVESVNMMVDQVLRFGERH